MRCCVKQGLVIQDFGQELVIIDPESDKVHVLNGTGADILRALADSNDIPQVKKLLSRRYAAADRDDLSQDIEQFVQELVCAELVIWTD